MKFEFKKPEFKKPGVSTTLKIVGGLVTIIGMVVNSEQEKLNMEKTSDKAADKAYKKIMEQMSSKQD